VGVKNFFKKFLASEKIPPHTNIEEESDSQKGSDERGAAVTEQRQKPYCFSNQFRKKSLGISIS